MRTRILIKVQTKILKWVAFGLAAISVLPVIIQGMFSNEFICLSIICTTLTLSYHAYLHWLIRILVIPEN
jgi:Na+(H+)/acetate symporter ActP